MRERCFAQQPRKLARKRLLYARRNHRRKTAQNERVDSRRDAALLGRSNGSAVREGNWRSGVHGKFACMKANTCGRSRARSSGAEINIA